MALSQRVPLTQYHSRIDRFPAPDSMQPTRRHFFARAAAVLSAASGAVTLVLPAHAAKLVDMAQAMVEKYKLGHTLPQVALQLAAKSPDYQSLIDKMGAQQAQQQLIAAARQVVPAYQKQWDAQLANAYAQTFSEAQLKSLLELGPKSPHAQLMQSKQVEINQQMQKNASGMLRELLGKLFAAAQQPAAAAPAAKPAEKAKK